MTEAGLVSVVVVTCNSERDIEACLRSIGAQAYPEIELLVIDNASTDESAKAAARNEVPHRLVVNESNAGFAAAHNQGIRETKGEFYLALNPDVVLSPTFVEELVRGARLDPKIGSLSGKLLRPGPSDRKPILDSAGMFITPGVRHLDRGSGREDTGQFERLEYLFGASGAAAFYRRAMLEDVAIGGEYFDEDFFAYREDADLAWRAQLRGWRCLYTPRAVATHARFVVPERRDTVPELINMHSVKNRFLLRLKNQSLLELAVLVPALLRDLGVLLYVPFFERSSLPGLRFVWRHLRRIREKRRAVLSRRFVGPFEMLRWFRYRPVTTPCAEPSRPSKATSELTSTAASARETL